MKKILMIITFIFVACAVCISAPFALKSKAASVDDLTFKLNENGQSYSVTNCSEEALGEIVIPDTYNDLPVTSIGSEAFYNCTSLTSVTIGNSITSIGDSAFYNCHSLTSVHITSLASWCNIKFGQYYGYGGSSVGTYSNPLCYAKNLYLNGELITELIIPDGVTEIKNYAFSGCSSLTSVTIPDGVTSIGSYAFYNCSSLASIKIPDGVTSIGTETFNGCSSLTSVTIPDKVPRISYGVFNGCSSLTSITIPVSVTSIYSTAFNGCSSLTSVHITSLASWCNIDFANPSANPLYYAKNLYLNGELVTELAIPEGVTEIKNYAFSGCSSLTRLTIPDSVTSIGSSAFSGCSSLTSVNIPDSVTSIGSSAFSDCYSLASITIPNGVNSIEQSTFRDCSSLTSITIPDGVTSIGNYAFDGCSSLTSVTILDNITSIGSFAFSNCSSLSSVHITNLASWCNIDFANPSANPLYYAKNLYLNGELITKLVIPDGITSIGDYAFNGSTSIKSVTIPVSVTSIGNSAFSNCNGSLIIRVYSNSAGLSFVEKSGIKYSVLDEVALEDNIEFSLNIDEKSYTVAGFLNETNCATLEIPESYNGFPVTHIDSSAFKGCTSLINVIIPSTVTNVGYSAFYECISLENIRIPDSVTNIGADAFYRTTYYNDNDNWENGVLYICNHLIKAKNDISGAYTIKEGTKHIASSAFSSCTPITSVTIPDSITSIGSFAFNDCSSLTSVHITNLDSWCNINFANPSANPLYCAKNLYLNVELITELVIPDGIMRIGDRSFIGCTSITGVTIPDSVTSIGWDAFEECSSLTSVHITNFASWCNIDFANPSANPLRYAKTLFLNNTIIKNTIIPEGITEIKPFAFYNCTSISGVKIPESLEKIGESAFNGCTNITLVAISDLEKWCTIDFANYSANPLYCAENLYLNGKLITELGVPEGITKIKSATFTGGSFKSVVIPDSVTSIGDYAFYGCSSLTNATIPDSVTSIGEDAFYCCSSLTSITIPDGVTSIGHYAFYNCSSLTSVNITDLAAWWNIDFIGSYANPLCYANNLYLNRELVTELAIPEGITEIKNYAFYGCSSLTGVTIPVGVTSIGSSAFDGCSSLASVIIPDSITSIGSDTFKYCYALKYVFYTGSPTDWSNISIDSGNEYLTSQAIHYNSTEHSHSITKSLPFFEGMDGSIEDVCPICDFVNNTEKLIWLNDYITAIDTKNVVVDTTNNTLILDISACKDINDALIEMDGYTLTTTTNSDYGYYGTGSKVYVADSAGALVAEYTLVVRGDVNGDSVCDALDCMLVELARNKHITLDGVYFDAANLSEDTQIDTNDFNAVVNKALI